MKRNRKTLAERMGEIREQEYDRAYRDSLSSLVEVMDAARKQSIDQIVALDTRIIVNEIFDSIITYINTKLTEPLAVGEASTEMIVEIFDEVRTTAPLMPLDRVVALVARRCNVEAAKVMSAIYTTETGKEMENGSV